MWTVDGVAAAFSPTLIDLANQFTANPFKILEITNFPFKDEKVIFSLIDPAVNGVPSGSGTASCLNLDLGVDVRVDGLPSGDEAGSFNDSISKIYLTKHPQLGS